MLNASKVRHLLLWLQNTAAPPSMWPDLAGHPLFYQGIEVGAALGLRG